MVTMLWPGLDKYLTMNILYLLPLSFLGACIGSNHIVMHPPLTVETTLLDPPARMDKPLYLRVTLKNTGKKTETVNARLSMGYENSLSREIFVRMGALPISQGRIYYEADIDRDFSRPEDYVLLQPGHSISNVINLFEYYQPIKPGKYEIVVCYQGNEPLAFPPADILSGIFCSTALVLDILPAS